MIYPVSQVLSRFRLDIDGMCNVETETIICHLFFDCICTKLFWIEIWILDREHLTGSNVRLEKRDIIFSHDKSDIDGKRLFTLNLFILYRKHLIHKCKWTTKKPHVQHFKVEFRHYIGTLRGLKNSKALRTLKICKDLNIVL